MKKIEATLISAWAKPESCPIAVRSLGSLSYAIYSLELFNLDDDLDLSESVTSSSHNLAESISIRRGLCSTSLSPHLGMTKIGAGSRSIVNDKSDNDVGDVGFVVRFHFLIR